MKIYASAFSDKPGVPVRLWLAAQAMKGLLASDMEAALNTKICAAAAMHCADALLEEYNDKHNRRTK